MPPPTPPPNPLVSRLIAVGASAVLAWRRRRRPVARTALPADAEAGQLRWTESSLVLEGERYRVDEGTLVVPENRGRPDGRLIAIPVRRIRTPAPAPGPPLFWLGDGPGASNLAAAPRSWLLAGQDLVIVGYRGADGSTVLSCPELVRAQRGAGRDLLSQASRHSLAAAARKCVAGWQAAGVDLGGYRTAEVVADLEAVRAALSAGRISLLGEGYGSGLALQYAWRFPERVARSVLIGVTPPGGTLWEPEKTDQIIRRYSQLYARQGEATRQTADLAATLERVLATMPPRWGLFPIDPGKVRFVAFGMLYQRREAALLFDALLKAERGDPAGLALMTLLYDLTIINQADAPVGDLLAKNRGHCPPDFDYTNYTGGPDALLGSPVSAFLLPAIQAWPAPDTEGADRPAWPGPAPTCPVPTLILSGNLDVAAPAGLAEALLPRLPQGRQLVMRDAGHGGDLWQLQPEAVQGLVNHFLVEGEIDDSGLRHEVMSFAVDRGLPELFRLGLRTLLLGLAVLVTTVLLLGLWLLL